MHAVIGVKFGTESKIVYYLSNEKQIDAGRQIIAKTENGLEVGRVMVGTMRLCGSKRELPKRSIVREVTKKDERTLQRIAENEKVIYRQVYECIKKHHLDMKLVDVKCTFDERKLLIYFTADERVDFRELVKELVHIFHKKIELRQIGVRDEAKILGGFGVCGRNYCCFSYLHKFHSVSMKMARDQNLSLNPAKVSGACGRLMCCLNYEQKDYERMIKGALKIGSKVKTAQGSGVILERNLLTNTYKVKLGDHEEGSILSLSKDELICETPSKPENKQRHTKKNK